MIFPWTPASTQPIGSDCIPKPHWSVLDPHLGCHIMLCGQFIKRWSSVQLKTPRRTWYHINKAQHYKAVFIQSILPIKLFFPCSPILTGDQPSSVSKLNATSVEKSFPFDELLQIEAKRFGRLTGDLTHMLMNSVSVQLQNKNMSKSFSRDGDLILNQIQRNLPTIQSWPCLFGGVSCRRPSIHCSR